MGRREYGGGGNAMEAAATGLPGWLGRLVEESFFVGCGAHESRKKNEKNIFCLDCCTSICPHCAPAHSSHPLLQVKKQTTITLLLLPSQDDKFTILPSSTTALSSCCTVRRYVYNDVVRLDDLEKLIDCSYVQPYTINSAKVVFLKPRPQSRPFKGSGNICLTCDRILQEPFHFCSLSCKVDHVLLQGEDLSSILFRFNESDFAFSTFENLRMDSSDLIDDDGQVTTPSSILEDPVQYHGCSASSNSGKQGAGSEAPKKKKKSGGFFPQIVLSLSNRRKGAPHRSPLS
ncbi:PLATZ transcription factor [Musa troglodytarum]|uniref:PLATZ transcription factor n=1 Tax=Musa troglodytarum TaxID=320322 RepID=A0A9E7HAF5_9LILI|nr:PLATZ transcription factor [Musa troglodytarum]